MTINHYKWSGTVFGICGALLVAMNVAASGWGWVLFLISSTCWLRAAIAMKDRPLIILNFVFSAINILGIYQWILT